jgi:soluble P-type ATPase
MMEIDVPGYKTFRLRHLVLDVNGTLALDGALLPGVAERLAALKGELEVHLITADTHGRQKEMDRLLNLVAVILPPSSAAGSQREAKAAFVQGLGAEGVVAIGNGNNDAGMVEAAGLGIAVLGPEGLATQALMAADVVCASINDALDLLLCPDRLRATLRV